MQTLRYPRFGLLAFRGCGAFIASTCSFTAVTMMPLVEMMGITFFRPIFVSIPAILFLGEIAHDRRWITIPAGFGAELIIVRPGIQVLNWGRWLS